MTSGIPTEDRVAAAIAEAENNSRHLSVKRDVYRRMARAAIEALGLADETATIPIPVEEDEMDYTHLEPRPKWHMDWQHFTRQATSWRNEKGQTLDEAREAGRVPVEGSDQ